MSEMWKWRPLGELFEIGAGKTMSATARNGPDKTPFLRTSNVLWDEIDLASVDEMSIPEHELPTKRLRRGDLLVCEGGEIGRAAIWDGQVETMSFQNHLHRLRPAVTDIEPRFYVYFLQSAFTQLGLFDGAGNRTTIPNLSRSRLSELRIPHPPLSEQKAISAALSLVQSAIRTQDRGVALAQDLKRAAMRTLFTSGLRREPQKETEIGPIPDSWAIARIGEVFEIEQGLSVRRNLSHDINGTPFLRTSNVYWGEINLQTVSRMNVDDIPPKKLLSKGDLLVCEGGEIGRAAVWTGKIAKCLYQNHLHCLRAVDPTRTSPWFVMAWLEEGFKHRHIYEGVGSRTTISNLSRSSLAELVIPHPLFIEQHRTVAILNAISRKAEIHRRKRALLEKMFKTLLHKFMTREILAEHLGIAELHSAISAGGRFS